MKKFNFKLEGLLKFREFKEYKIKLEMAKINSQIQKIKSRIMELRNNIDNCFEFQEGILKAEAGPRQLQLVGFLSQSARDNIKILSGELALLEGQFDKKLKEFLVAKGEVKVIRNLKDKNLAKFRNENMKKAEKEIEDILQSHASIAKREEL